MIVEKEQLLAVAQAVLLQNIGKLFFRVKSGEEHALSPLQETEEFFRKHAGVLPSGFPDASPEDLQSLIRFAHACAAGKSVSEIDFDVEAKDHEAARSAVLTAPWHLLQSEGSQGEEPRCYRLAVLDTATALEQRYYAKNEANLDHCEEYKRLAAELVARLATLAKIPATEQAVRFDALVSHLEHTTWCVPSFVGGNQTLSLYEHSRTAAAYAVAMLAYSEGAFDESRWAEKSLRFLVVDLASIQGYIYDMNKSGFKGLAKVLRGRSFYVTAMLRAVEIALLKQLGLPRCMTLMDGGGKLTLLLPNLADIEAKLDEFQKGLEDGLVEQTHGRLQLVLGVGEPFSPLEPSLNEALNTAYRDLEIRKHQPLAHYLTSGGANGCFNPLQSMIEADFSHGPCKACGKFPGSKPQYEKDVFYCDACDAHRELGAQLIKSSILAYTEQPDKSAYKMPGISLWLKLCNQDSIPQSSVSIQQLRTDKQYPYAVMYHAHHVRKWSAEEAERKNQEVAQSEEKVQKEGVMPFEDLANLGVDIDGKGMRALAIAAGDVDDLGVLFYRVMKRGSGALTLAMTVSRELDFFFSGVMDFQLRDRDVYTVYAGGDDMFYIGTWRTVLKEAAMWRENLRSFVGGYSKPSFSVGLMLAQPGVPIHHLHKEAEEQLKQAKYSSHVKTNSVNPKDRICVWDEAMSWEDWQKRVVAEKDLLQEWMKDGYPLTSGMAYRLLDYSRRASQCRDVSKSGDFDYRNYLWKSHLRYDIARNLRKHNGEYKKDCQPLYDHLKRFAPLEGEQSAEHEFESTYRIAQTWALYLTRGAHKKEAIEE